MISLTLKSKKLVEFAGLTTRAVSAPKSIRRPPTHKLLEVNHVSGKVGKIVYFEAPGPQNTDEVLRLAKERADALGIKDVVVASTTGETGVKASEVFKGFNLVVVSHAIGHVSPGVKEMLEENKKRILASGAELLTCIMAFTGIERAVKKTFGTRFRLS